MNRLPTRAGHVALVGPPNAGKSTLMNALVGAHLSIVTPKAQTTWRKVAGILTREDAQFIFLDTPGLLDPRDLLQRGLLAEAKGALRDADVVLLLLDPTQPYRTEWRELLEGTIGPTRIPRIVAINKTDAVAPERLVEYRSRVAEDLGSEPLEISATTGDQLDRLMSEITERLPVSPFLYPEDELATDPVRFFVSELVRETVFEQFRQEIPYSVFTQVEDFRQGGPGDRTYIQVNLFVERPSQKGILVGEGGAAIRALGTAARKKIEHFLEEPVYLELWVKVLPGWRKKRGHLRRLGIHVPEDDVHP